MRAAEHTGDWVTPRLNRRRARELAEQEIRAGLSSPEMRERLGRTGRAVRDGVGRQEFEWRLGRFLSGALAARFISLASDPMSATDPVSIQAGFRKAFACQFRWAEADGDEFADALFDLLRRAARHVIAAACDPKGLATRADLAFVSYDTALRLRSLSQLAQDSDSLRRAEHAEQMRYAEQTVQLLELLAQHDDIREGVDGYEQALRQQISRGGFQMRPPHLDDGRAVYPLRDLIVVPGLSRYVWDSNLLRPIPVPMDLDVLLAEPHALVVGDPGGGKSTLLDWLTSQLVTDSITGPSGRSMIGLRLPLAAVAERGSAGSSLLRALEREADRLLPRNRPQETMEVLLDDGRIAVLLDGIDEVPGPGERRGQVIGAIKALVGQYPFTSIVVTSRDSDPAVLELVESGFTLALVRPFEPEQIHEYAGKYAALRHQPSPEAWAEAFMLASDELADLRSNPLMLSLMCEVYCLSGDLASSRVELLDQMIELWISRWDEIRQLGDVWGLREPEVHRAVVRLALELVATTQWNQTNTERAAGGTSLPANVVSETELLVALETAFANVLPDRQAAAHTYAQMHLDQIRARSWLLRPALGWHEGTRLWEFTHRPFEQVFLARALVRHTHSAEQLVSVLKDTVTRPGGPFVAEVAFQIAVTHQSFAYAALADLVADAHASEGGEALGLLTFALRAIATTEPSPEVTTLVASAATEKLLEWGSWLWSATDATPLDELGLRARRAKELASSLTKYGAAAGEAPSQAVSASLVSHLAQGGPTAAAAADLALNLCSTLRDDPAERKREGPRRLWCRSVQGQAKHALLNALPSLECRHELSEAGAMLAGWLSVADVLEAWGIEGLFHTGQGRVTDAWTYAPADYLLDVWTGPERGEGPPEVCEERLRLVEQVLTDLGGYLLRRDPPWVAASNMPPEAPGMFWRRRWPEEGSDAERRLLSSPAVRGALFLFAVLAELVLLGYSTEDGRVPVVDALPREAPAAFGWLIAARNDRDICDESLNGLLDDCHLRGSARELMRRWARGEVDFVQAPGSDE